MKRSLLLVGSHAVALGIGFLLGIYTLPILTAPPPPSDADVQSAAAGAIYTGEFRRDLEGSDPLHWGEGTVSIARRSIAFAGRLAPGPSYKLYLSPEFVETEADFLQLKSRMLLLGDVRTFNNFVVQVPSSVDVDSYSAVIVWCESFDQFITAARYR